MELYPGLRLIDTPFEDTRQINVWLFGTQRPLLVDSGVAGCPTETILPRLGDLGLTATDLALVLNLHAHADHVGGNGELYAASEGTLRFGAHELDAPAIEDHHLLASRVYGLTEAGAVEAFLARCGADVPVARRYRGGEVIDLEDFSLRVIHAPGHTAGNVALYDPAHRALVHGESVMGAPQADAEGLRFTPFGGDPAAYGAALRRLMALPFEVYLSSHRPPADGAAGRAEISASLDALERFERAVRAALTQGAPDVSALIAAVAAEGGYRRSPWIGRQVESLLSQWVREGRAARGEDGRLAAVR